MALDKLVDSAQLDADLEDVADAIRAKGGTSAQLAFPAGFVSAIGDISTGGGDPNENLIKANNNTLTSFSDDEITTIRGYMFYGNSLLTAFDFSNVTGIQIGAFMNAGLAGDVTVPNFLNPCANYIFRACPMTSITFKSGVFRIDISAFEGCRNLQAIDIGDWGNNTILNIAGASFYNTQALAALIIRGNTVFPLGSAFAATCGLSTTLATGYIYVPSSLVTLYETATNWSAYAGRISPIEGSIYETQWANGEAIS